MSPTDDSFAYPGEFEVLRTKTEAGLWDSGTLVVTNHRVSWTPKRFASTPSFSFRLDDIESVKLVRTVKYLFLGPSLRIRLRTGAVYELARTGEDINRVRHVIEDYRKRERYRPGSLFEDGP